MNIYEFITPSDPITFKAQDNKTAFVCAIILGEGMAGCQNITTDESIPTMTFNKDATKHVDDYLGCKLNQYIDSNLKDIIECYQSFSYGSASDRQTYDDACEAISDTEKLKEFKAKHEDRNRTSMSAWVKQAWQYAELLKKIEKGT